MRFKRERSRSEARNSGMEEEASVTALLRPVIVGSDCKGGEEVERAAVRENGGKRAVLVGW
jgi:hypothetical protein